MTSEYESQDLCAVCSHTITCHTNTGCLGGGTALCKCRGFRSPAEKNDDAPAKVPRAQPGPPTQHKVGPGAHIGSTPISFTSPVISNENLAELLDAMADFCMGQSLLHESGVGESAAWFDAAYVRLRGVARKMRLT